MRTISQGAVLVVGDLMLDTTISGSMTRISPEAPSPVVSITGESHYPGGAANVAMNLLGLGVPVVLVGVVGTDAAANSLDSLLRQYPTDRFLYVPVPQPQLATTTKVRVAVGGQQVFRLDRDSYAAAASPTVAATIRQLPVPIAAAVVSDYAKGVVTAEVMAAINERRGTTPIFVDAKPASYQQGHFAGAHYITPNFSEALAVVQGCGIVHPALAFEADDALVAKASVVAPVLRQYLNVYAAVVTCGYYGAVVATPDTTFHVATDGVDVADPTGAGDTFIAGMVSQCMAGQSDLSEMVKFANAAAGVAVRSHGTVAVTQSQVLERLSRTTVASKLMSATEAAMACRSQQLAGKSVVFTNGCFDVFHPGHAALLRECRKLGHFVVVGLNSDAGVRRLKGDSRPRYPEADRVAMLQNSQYVDVVVVFDEDTPEDLIKHCHPDVLVKGEDTSRTGAIPGADYVASRGGDVVIVQKYGSYSTTWICGG